MEIDVKVIGLDKLTEALDRIGGVGLAQLIQRATRKIGEHTKSLLMRYPGPPSHPIKWASDKQRKWWFAARASGVQHQRTGIARAIFGKKTGQVLPPGYTRISDPWSQRLKDSWVVTPVHLGASVGTPVTYAGYVMSQEKQTAQHKATGWQTDADVVAEVERSGVIEAVFDGEIEAAIE